MAKILSIIAAMVLVLHGLIHVIGTVADLKLGSIEGFSYKTALLGRHWEVGERGMWIFSALWAVAAIGFVVAAVALLAEWGWWKAQLIGVTLFSLALNALDWSTAYAGFIIDSVILTVLGLGPRLATWFSP